MTVRANQVAGLSAAIERVSRFDVPADTALTYAIGGDFREFKATVGILDQVGDSATEATVTIEGDGRVLFSDTIRRKDKPKGVTLAQQSTYTKQAMNYVAESPYIYMFIWFIFRDDPTSTWQSGLENVDNSRKPI